METFKGTCHCGKVEFSFSLERPLTCGLRCNCSICKRLGCLHSPILSLGGIDKLKGEEFLRSYSFDEHEITWYFCKECSIYLFYESDVQCRANLGCVDEVDTFQLETAFCDGAKF